MIQVIKENAIQTSSRNFENLLINLYGNKNSSLETRRALEEMYPHAFLRFGWYWDIKKSRELFPETWATRSREAINKKEKRQIGAI